ncbi:MAG TPA: hypothetical protein PKG90_01265 [Chitinophagaceae bacterium]|nr:hypothetical protein [Chitinophagaceae bacterium]
MKATITLLIAVVTMIAACKDSNENSSSLKDNLTGDWISHSLKVEMSSAGNSDRDSVFEANASNWADVIGIKPIITHFRPDGTYNSEHYSKKDSLFYNPYGKWQIAGDSLIMNDTTGGNIRYAYRTEVKNDTAYFWGLEDFDQDGKVDDKYYGTQVRIKKN